MNEMTEERAAKAWELAAEICAKFDCKELNPPRSSNDLEDLDVIIDEMRQNAERLRSDSAFVQVLAGVHSKLISPNSATTPTQQGEE